MQFTSFAASHYVVSHKGGYDNMGSRRLTLPSLIITLVLTPFVQSVQSFSGFSIYIFSSLFYKNIYITVTRIRLHRLHARTL